MHEILGRLLLETSSSHQHQRSRVLDKDFNLLISNRPTRSVTRSTSRQSSENASEDLLEEGDIGASFGFEKRLESDVLRGGRLHVGKYA